MAAAAILAGPPWVQVRAADRHRRAIASITPALQHVEATGCHVSASNLPRKHCFPLIALVLGYAAHEPAYQNGRLSGKGIVDQGTFHNLTGEEADVIIRQYDDKTLHLGLNEDWDQKGHKHYLDWLHKEWLGRSRKPGETQILDRLRKAGFVEGA